MTSNDNLNFDGALYIDNRKQKTAHKDLKRGPNPNKSYIPSIIKKGYQISFGKKTTKIIQNESMSQEREKFNVRLKPLNEL